MTNKELEKLSKQLMDGKVTHLFLAKTRSGISLSSMATGDDIYDFLQIVADMDDAVADMMQDIVSRKRKKGQMATDDSDEMPN